MRKNLSNIQRLGNGQIVAKEACMLHKKRPYFLLNICYKRNNRTTIDTQHGSRFLATFYNETPFDQYFWIIVTGFINNLYQNLVKYVCIFFSKARKNKNFI